MAEPDSCSSARGRADAKTHVRGINFPWEGCNWASTLSNPGRHLGFQYTYDETVVDRQKVTNLRLPGQYDERLLSSLGLQGPYYNWNRWYLPGVGRYLELEPLNLGTVGVLYPPHQMPNAFAERYLELLEQPQRNGQVPICV